MSNLMNARFLAAKNTLKTAPHVGQLLCYSIRKMHMRDRSKIIVNIYLVSVIHFII